MRISDLPQAYKKLAELRTSECTDHDFKICRSTNPDELMYAFSWSDTPEGSDFWRAVSNAYTEKGLPELPYQISENYSIF